MFFVPSGYEIVSYPLPKHDLNSFDDNFIFMRPYGKIIHGFLQFYIKLYKYFYREPRSSSRISISRGPTTPSGKNKSR